MRHGVPQGSCLGPLLFTIYTSKLFEIVQAHLPQVHVHADDTQLCLSFEPGSEVCQQGAIDAIQDCVSSIRTWMIVDTLKLNEDKTKIIYIDRNTASVKQD